MLRYSYFLVFFFILKVSFGVNSTISDSDSLKQDFSEVNYSNEIEFSDSEKEWLKKHPVIKVGSDPNWAPFEFRDKKGNYNGIVIDYLKLFENILNIKFEFAQDETWGEMVDKVKSKELDIISGISKTSERESYLNFTQPYITYPISIFANKEITHIRDLDELIGGKVAVVEGYITGKYLRQDYPNIEIIYVKNPQEALNLLNKNEVIAFVGGMITATYYLNELEYESIQLVGETKYQYSIGMGVREDWTIFYNILQKALNSISESEKNQIYYNWVSISNNKKFDYSLLLKILIPAFIIYFFFIFWNRSLRIEVKKRKKAQEELDLAYKKLKDTQAQLVQAEKMVSIGILTAGITHEIKNPLNYISLAAYALEDVFDSFLSTNKNYEELLETCSNNSKEIEKIKKEHEYEYNKDKTKTMVSDIQKGVDIIVEIIKSMNSFSRISDSDKTLANINYGINNTLILLRSQYKHDIEILKDLGEIPDIKCFPGKLNQVFVNVISNATQAIKKKGTINIKTYQENNNIKVSIKDSGKGIEESKLESIFEPFYTTKPEGEGSGLGLAISKNIIDEHDGKIEIFSEPEKGTEFIISIPIAV